MNNRQFRTHIFELDISQEQFLHYYKGNVSQVLVTSLDNIKIQFPAQFIQKFVTHNGIKGRFRIIFDENNKLVSLNRVNIE